MPILSPHLREISLKISDEERRKVACRLHLSSQVKFHSFFSQSKREISFEVDFSLHRTQLDIVKMVFYLCELSKSDDDVT